MKDGISLGKGLLWTLLWFGFMLLYTALDLYVWRCFPANSGGYLNVLSIALCIAVFLILLTRKTGFSIHLFGSISGILLALGCSVLFYLLLDRGLDPILKRVFPASEADYQRSLQSLSAAPIPSLLQTCLLAPIIEEILMRGFLLYGLSIHYGKPKALLVSAILFALLHFNLEQTLSALLCGITLGLLYLYTNSTFCCILAHMGYNLISFATSILPLCRA